MTEIQENKFAKNHLLVYYSNYTRNEGRSNQPMRTSCAMGRLDEPELFV
jgi:hypothetical protein